MLFQHPDLTGTPSLKTWVKHASLPIVYASSDKECKLGLSRGLAHIVHGPTSCTATKSLLEKGPLLKPFNATIK